MTVKHVFETVQVESLHSTKNHIVQIDSNAKPAQGFNLLIDNRIQSIPVFDLTANKYSGFLDIRDLVSFSLFLYDNNVKAETLLDLVNFGVKMFKHQTDVSVTYLSRRNPFNSIMVGSNLLKVVDILSKGTHRVPIVDKDGKLVDIISQSSIIQFIDKNVNSSMLPELDQKISQLDSLGISNVTSAKNTSLTIDVFRVMDVQGKSGVAIVDEQGKLIGSTSSADLKLFINNPSTAILQLPIMEFLNKIRLLNAIGGGIWDDTLVKQGTYGPGSTRLVGVKLELQDSTGKVLSTIPSNQDKTYSFKGLKAGDYCIVASQPGFTPTVKKNQMAFDSNGKFCTKVGPSVTDAHLGMIASADATFELGGGIWDDTMLKTDSAGKVLKTIDSNTEKTYSFKGLKAGDYCVVASKAGYKPTALAYQNVFDDKGKFCIILGPSKTGANLGMISTTTFELGGGIWDDTMLKTGTYGPGSPQLIGLKLELQDSAGKVLKTIDSTTEKTYSFKDLPPGKYCVVGSKPGYRVTALANQNVFDDKGKFCTTLGPSKTDAHFGLIKT
ncbi:hypothetical protein SAMD00019534_106060 [Acytostelium subglobosum LB1]|uniref:hypothetical protein n=1 Tax=Acytostelium subglobosum LB1 TaxID=1410327 RepID=UPI0006451327|nr:hypothetical protein SAMD00019534_106060 [Acytostelium subglobosum LB1]GAM27430.1 hypothetical protein SAMD00019534_106060 [Acytostelium subglobosum LB1]|eukprot:XP_012749495.1 hypothetical protein SAMD00019534_106060 [Acytostelium subglobosum LB1]